MVKPKYAFDNDYYEVLGVPPSASAESLKAAYRSLIKQHHPDLGLTAGQEDLARRFNEAYTVLRDPVSRKEYDHHRRIRLGASRRSIIHASHDECYKHGSRHETVLFEYSKSRYSYSRLFAAFLAFTGVGAGFLIVSEFTRKPDALSSISTVILVPEKNRLLVDLPRLRPDDIEAGAFKFLDVWRRSGISGASEFSMHCHKQAGVSRSWRMADQCASFDYTAAFLSNERLRLMGEAKSNYFENESQHQEQNYYPFKVDRYNLSNRLKDMKRTIEFRIATASSSGRN